MTEAARSDITLLLRATKGAPLAVFVAMIALRHIQTSFTGPELQRITGYSKQAIERARSVLIDLELAAALGPAGRYGLRLTSKGARQLDLPFVEGALSSLPSSSGYISKPNDQVVDQQQQQPATDEKQPPLADDLQKMVALLMARGCYNAHTARNAIVAAHEADWSIDQIECAILTWYCYATSPAGHTIKTPGFFVAARIKALDDLIEFIWQYSQGAKRNEDVWRAWRGTRADDLRRISELGGEDWHAHFWGIY